MVLIAENENPNIDYTDVMRNKSAYLTYEEINKMLNYCLQKSNTSRNKVMHYMLIMILSRTGRRISEIIGKKPYTSHPGLRPIDLHHDNNLIEWHILKKRPIRRRDSPHGKKRSDDLMQRLKDKKLPPNKLQPIDTKTMILLRKYIEANNIGTYDRIFPITRQGAWKIIKVIGVKNKIVRKKGYIHPHMFRHGFSINFLKKNPFDSSALIKLQRILEHSDIKITQGYAQFTPEDIKLTLNEIFEE